MSAPKLQIRFPLDDTGLAISLWVSSTTDRGFFAQLQKTETRYSWNRVMATMQKFYAQAAQELNELAVEEFKKSRKRPGVSTKRLEKALVDPRNMRILQDGYRVGYGRFMKTSEARYWRQIDEGTTVHVGRLLPAGLWGASLNGRWAVSEKGNRYALTKPPYALPGKSTGGKFQPLSTATKSGVRSARAEWRRDGGEGRFPPRPRIRREIEAEHYYHRAYLRWSRTNRPLNLLVAVMRAEFRWTQPIRSYDQLMAALT